MFDRAYRLALVSALAVVASGCIVVGGSSHAPSKGQELLDLKAALDRGAITQGEYDSTKAQIMSRR
jgi:hypothetical protein